MTYDKNSFLAGLAVGRAMVRSDGDRFGLHLRLGNADIETIQSRINSGYISDFSHGINRVEYVCPLPMPSSGQHNYEWSAQSFHFYSVPFMVRSDSESSVDVEFDHPIVFCQGSGIPHDYYFEIKNTNGWEPWKPVYSVQQRFANYAGDPGKSSNPSLRRWSEKGTMQYSFKTYSYHNSGLMYNSKLPTNKLFRFKVSSATIGGTHSYPVYKFSSNSATEFNGRIVKWEWQENPQITISSGNLILFPFDGTT